MSLLNMQRLHTFSRRLGTRGFLAPETIFNSKTQTKAVDIWAAGIILLSFFTQRIPVLNLNKFSKIKEMNIKEILPLILIFGANRMTELALKYGVYLYIPDTIKQYELEDGLRTMMMRDDIDESGYDLLSKMLELDSDRRITAEATLNHAFFKDV
jgi:cell division control protein 7